MESTWDRLGNISASIDYLNKIKKKVASSLSAAYQSTSHSESDTSSLVWRVADKVKAESLLNFIENREGNNKAKPVINILAEGEAKLKSSSIGTFNKKFLAMVEGRLHDDELEPDTLPLLGLEVDVSEVTSMN